MECPDKNAEKTHGTIQFQVIINISFYQAFQENFQTPDLLRDGEESFSCM